MTCHLYRKNKKLVKATHISKIYITLKQKAAKAANEQVYNLFWSLGTMAENLQYSSPPSKEWGYFFFFFWVWKLLSYNSIFWYYIHSLLQCRLALLSYNVDWENSSESYWKPCTPKSILVFPTTLVNIHHPLNGPANSAATPIKRSSTGVACITLPHTICSTYYIYRQLHRNSYRL